MVEQNTIIGSMMKKYFLILGMLVIAVVNTFAGYRYTTNNLNLRQGPGKNYDAITIIPQGTRITIEEDCDCKWIAVSYCGNIGYVSSRYLSKEYLSYHNTSVYNNSHKTRNANSYGNSKKRYYTNTNGYRVQSPSYSNTSNGATAICRDGTYSYSRNRRGTCSHH